MAVAMVSLLPTVASCRLGWAWLQVLWERLLVLLPLVCQSLNGPSNTFFFYLSEPELVSVACNQKPWIIQWHREQFIPCSLFSYSLFSHIYSQITFSWKAKYFINLFCHQVDRSVQSRLQSQLMPQFSDGFFPSLHCSAVNVAWSSG